MIQDILRDVIKYVHGVGVFPAVKVDQTANGVTLSSTNAEKTVVMTATSALKFSDAETTFGLGQLDLLQRLLDCPEYEENVSIGLGQEGDKLDRIEFANAAGDFTNNYRLMSKALVETLVPPTKFVGAKWAVEFAPPLASVQRFNLQASTNPGETSFVIKTVKNNLEVSFGTPATHSGRFVFANGITGKTMGDLPFSVPVFQKVLNLSAHAQSATLKMADRGLMCMTLNSGLVEYNYYLIGLSK